MQTTCEECRKKFNPFDDEHATQATKLIPSRAEGRPGWDWTNALIFCSASCLHKFANPDTA